MRRPAKMILRAMLDKKLYGRSFFSRSFVYVVLGLVIQFSISFLRDTRLLALYLPFYIGMIMVLVFLRRVEDSILSD